MNTNAIAQQEQTAVAPRGMGFDLSPQSFEQAMTFANMLADSDLVPKDFKGKPGNCLIAMQWGSELGLKPLQALSNIAVVNGRAALWGDAVIALVRGSPLCEFVKESDDGHTATCVAKRKGEREHTVTFSMDDAKQAGLAGKQGPWTQYPKRMRQMRARAFALRDVFPDVLRGMPVAEEVMDAPNERHMGQVERVDPAASAGPATLPPYPADKFSLNLPKWRAAIATGKATAGAVIDKASTVGVLSAAQEQAIRAPLEPAKQAQPQQPPPSVTDVQPKGEAAPQEPEQAQVVTEQQIGDRMHRAATLDDLYTAADLIGEVADPEARARLTDFFGQRQFALESE